MDKRCKIRRTNKQIVGVAQSFEKHRKTALISGFLSQTDSNLLTWSGVFNVAYLLSERRI